MNDSKDPGTPHEEAASPDMTRREALAKLAKYSAYTAPTVMTLLASRPSMAQLTSAQCVGINDGTGITDPADKPPGTVVEGMGTGKPYDAISTGDHPIDDGMADTTGSGAGNTGVNFDMSANNDFNVNTNDTTIDCGS